MKRTVFKVEIIGHFTHQSLMGKWISVVPLHVQPFHLNRKTHSYSGHLSWVTILELIRPRQKLNKLY